MTIKECIEATKGFQGTFTVGDLKKLLENYNDEKPVSVTYKDEMAFNRLNLEISDV